jgi:hypothetical protein
MFDVAKSHIWCAYADEMAYGEDKDEPMWVRAHTGQAHFVYAATDPDAAITKHTSFIIPFEAGSSLCPHCPGGLLNDAKAVFITDSRAYAG